MTLADFNVEMAGHNARQKRALRMKAIHAAWLLNAWVKRRVKASDLMPEDRTQLTGRDLDEIYGPIEGEGEETEDETPFVMPEGLPQDAHPDLIALVKSLNSIRDKARTSKEVAFELPDEEDEVVLDFGNDLALDQWEDEEDDDAGVELAEVH